MNMALDFEKCLTFVNCQLRPGSGSLQSKAALPRRAVTISRQGGSGGHAVALALAQRLQAQTPSDQCPWTIFDRDLVKKVLEDHHLPQKLARFMPEDRISEITDTLDELFGLHPPSLALVRQTADTILRLVELGNVIIIGRGANVTTARLDYVFHVRLVGSLEHRVAHMQQIIGCDQATASRFVQREDLGRKRYLKKYFDKDIDDPLLYHLIINTDLISYEEAAELIAHSMLRPSTMASNLDMDHAKQAA